MEWDSERGIHAVIGHDEPVINRRYCEPLESRNEIIDRVLCQDSRIGKMIGYKNKTTIVNPGDSKPRTLISHCLPLPYAESCVIHLQE